MTARVHFACVDVRTFSGLILISSGFCHSGELVQSSDEVKVLVFLNATSHFLLFTSLFVLKGYFCLASDKALHHLSQSSTR